MKKKLKEYRTKELIFWIVFCVSYLLLVYRIGFINAFLTFIIFVSMIMILLYSILYKFTEKRKEFERLIIELHDELHKEKK